MRLASHFPGIVSAVKHQPPSVSRLSNRIAELADYFTNAIPSNMANLFLLCAKAGVCPCIPTCAPVSFCPTDLGV